MLRALLFVFALAACGGRSTGSPAQPPAVAEADPAVTTPAPARPAPPPKVVNPGGLADGAACLTADACASGVCEGEGCADSAPGTCMPATRMCTYDLRTYCGCDGATFQASGSCPGQRFARRGSCEAPDAE